MRCSTPILALLLAVAGCRMEQPSDYQSALKSYQADSSRVARLDRLKAASARAAAHADSVIAREEWTYERPRLYKYRVVIDSVRVK